MSEKVEPMDEYYFCSAMSKYSTTNRQNICNLWERIVQQHEGRPYHNLNLTYSDLKNAENIQRHVPELVIVAATFRYCNFNPAISKNLEKVIEQTQTCLSSPFGWKWVNVDEVLNLIRSNSILHFPKNDRYEIKLMHDMKMARLAKSYLDFIQDRVNARKEFQSIGDKQFYLIDRGLLRFYNGMKELFCLNSFQHLTAQSRHNIGQRLQVINEKLDILKNK